MSIEGEPRSEVIRAVNTPLGFFVLALLIVEGFLGMVLIYSDLSQGQKFCGMWTGIALFLILVIVVSLFAWFKPMNLTFRGADHLAKERSYGTDQDPKTREDVVAEESTEESTTAQR